MILAALLLVLVMVAVSALFFVKYKRAANISPANQQQQLVKQLSQLIEMPPDQPIISTVLDKSKLSNPVLASRARNGDNLFIFPLSKRLILYRPSDNKVVDMLNIR
jgi:hypothetical protein